MLNILSDTSMPTLPRNGVFPKSEASGRSSHGVEVAVPQMGMDDALYGCVPPFGLRRPSVINRRPSFGICR